MASAVRKAALVLLVALSLGSDDAEHVDELVRALKARTGIAEIARTA